MTFTLLWGVYVGSPASAASTCFIGKLDETLESFCLLRHYATAITPIEDRRAVDARLRRSGIASGLGFGYELPGNTLQVELAPRASYVDNVNGGNPVDYFRIGDAVFVTPNEYRRTSDFVIGVDAAASARFFIAPAAFTTLDLGANVLYSPEHDQDIRVSSGKLCVHYFLASGTKSTVCVAESSEDRDLGSRSSQVAQITLSQYVLARSAVREISFGVGCNIHDCSDNVRLLLNFSSIEDRGYWWRVFSQVDAAIDSDAIGARGVGARLGGYVSGKYVDTGFFYGDTGDLFAFGANNFRETSLIFDVGVEIKKGVTLRAGYRSTSAQIEGLSRGEPIFQIEFSPFKF